MGTTALAGRRGGGICLLSLGLTSLSPWLSRTPAGMAHGDRWSQRPCLQKDRLKRRKEHQRGETDS